MAQAALESQSRIDFNTDPSRYKHWSVKYEGPIARAIWNVNEDATLRPGYKLKLNSYDLGVDIELHDLVQRMRFEHPEVKVVCVQSGKDNVFSAGANIFMLGLSSHSHKVNFCKFTNETRNNIEECTRLSGQFWLAALKGVSSGGGYEMPLACAEIHLVDDKKSSVSLPEVPYLGVLPGTGGLTRLVDKRRVRRDHADVFCTLAEGIKGKKAVDWKLVDAVHPASGFDAAVTARLNELAKTLPDVNGKSPKGVKLDPLHSKISGDTLEYGSVTLKVDTAKRTASILVKGPSAADAKIPADPCSLGSGWYALRMWRELADALYQLRFNYEDVGCVTLETQGDLKAQLELDKYLWAQKNHWFVREVLLMQGRVLKMLDVTARTFYTLVLPGSCFGGALLEMALTGDRIYMQNVKGNVLATSELNGGIFPMGHGLTRLENRFYQDKKAVDAVLATRGKSLSAEEAEALGLTTEIPDEIDWDDEVRVQIEERASLSPDALTGMEANLRFAGPETMETRIFGRLSAWQNWIFTRPNATGEKGALTSYGKPTNAEFNWRRT